MPKTNALGMPRVIDASLPQETVAEERGANLADVVGLHKQKDVDAGHAKFQSVRELILIKRSEKSTV